MTLTDEQLDRYARHIVLHEVGGAGQMRLLGSRVLMIGAGGIGCPVLQALAGAGVGQLTIVDDDLVSLSNLQRQFLFTTADIGRPKAEVAAERVGALNPDCTASAVRTRVTADTVDQLLAGHDLVIDGTDNFATRLLVSDAATRTRVPLLTAAVGRFQGQVALWRGWLPDQPCYRCFVGDAFDADDCDNCANVGVLGAMTALTGSLAALEAIRFLTGFGEAQGGRLHLIDGLKPAQRTLRVGKDPSCRGCG